MYAPGASKLAAEFHVASGIIVALSVTIPSLGASMGPLLLAPLSEVTGRVPIYLVSAILFLGFNVGCARSIDMAMFLVFRFLSGACAASFMTCGGGTIADLLAKEERGAATAVFTAGPLLGPVIGPIIGGFVTQALGWRWTFYLVVMFVRGSSSLCLPLSLSLTPPRRNWKTKWPNFHPGRRRYSNLHGHDARDKCHCDPR